MVTTAPNRERKTAIIVGASRGLGLRRLEIDGVIRAVEIAKHVDGPVRVVWTREEDIQHDMYRPCFFDRMSWPWSAALRHHIIASA